MPPDTVKVDRTTRWGNPFRSHRDGVPMDAALAASLFAKMIEHEGGWISVKNRRGIVSIDTAEVRRELAGKNLACWCELGEPCHADVLLRIANAKS